MKKRPFGENLLEKNAVLDGTGGGISAPPAGGGKIRLKASGKKGGGGSLAKAPAIPARNEVSSEHQWNLKRIFPSDAAWRREFSAWSGEIDRFPPFRGALREKGRLAEFFRFETDFDRRSERLILYAYLKSVEDLNDPVYQGMKDEITAALARVGQAVSFVRPELLMAPKSVWDAWLSDKNLALWRRKLLELRRFKPHTLGTKEEKIVAMTAEMGQTASKAFRLLTDADLTFGTVKDETGTDRPLTHETFSVFLHSPDRSVRQNSFHRFYQTFADHKNSLAALLEGSVRRDIFYAKARNYSSAMEAALFSENIPMTVYDNLIDGVHRALPALHRYYDLRRRKMNLDNLHFYDTYVPILSDIRVRHSWDEAVGLIGEALSPLGPDYVRTLRRGLTAGRWADRYENAGKQSGAFSYGVYDTPPYIMTNFKPDLIESVFTLAHEGGHSMHSLLSARKQPYEYYDYVIFLAEIASTFNEQLLTERLLAGAKDRRFRAWVVNRQIDAIRATIFRQTMFSEFERIVHEKGEKGGILGIAPFREIYRGLLEKYFGPDFTLDADLELECLRIPHFYRAFYVYKYATGMSAAIALSRRVLHGGERERLDYFKMLEGGSSAPPLEILRSAGVDMEKPDAIDGAMTYFGELIDQLEELI